IVARRDVGLLKLLDGGHQDLGDVASAIGSEVPAGVGLGNHAASAALAARRKSIIFRWSLMPGADSMREHASTPQGRASATARATLEASRPPAMMIRLVQRAARRQSKLWPAP